ncbi:tetratricopeptide repeat protein [Phaeodactylibacter sp.]|uniref:tetratricopeptide repeat protein n=1 Tax=Phaeodactylibacter sp. TaxID=1940289 RepID=UPI0032EF1A8B
MKNELENIIKQGVARAVAQEALREELDSVHDELVREGKIPQQHKGRVIAMWPRIAAAAAVILLAIGFWWMQKPAQGTAIYAAHFEPLSTEVVSGSKGAEVDRKNGWVAAYNQGDYKRASEALNRCLSRQECPPFYNVYLGIAYLEQGMVEAAVETLVPLTEDSGLFIARRNLARYYLSLAYVQQGNYALSIEQLDAILASDNTNNPYYKKAKALRDELS